MGVIDGPSEQGTNLIQSSAQSIKERAINQGARNQSRSAQSKERAINQGARNQSINQSRRAINQGARNQSINQGARNQSINQGARNQSINQGARNQSINQSRSAQSIYQPINQSLKQASNQASNQARSSDRAGRKGADGRRRVVSTACAPGRGGDSFEGLRGATLAAAAEQRVLAAGTGGDVKYSGAQGWRRDLREIW